MTRTRTQGARLLWPGVDCPSEDPEGWVSVKSWTMEPFVSPRSASQTPPVTALTLARATSEFLKVSNALIQTLVLQVREPTEERQRLLSELELKRDAAHEHLDAMEAEYARAGRG